MPAKKDCIITSIYLTKAMCKEIDKKADRDLVSRTEQIRRYIEKGLSVDGYREDIDFIAGILRQEVLAIYHPEDIAKSVHETVAELTEKQASRIEKMQMKLGKTSAASYFLLVRVLMELYRNDNPADFAALVEKAGTMGVEFMKQKNSTVNEILKDGKHICRMAEQCL